MRKFYILLLSLALLVLSAGCTTQTAPAAPTPAPAVVTVVETPVEVLTVPAHKEINVTAWQTDRNVTVQYNGGRDAAFLTTLYIQIDNKNGQKIRRTILTPVTGSPIVFTYLGTVNADTVNVIGKFSDGTKQTVLLTYV
ncbi:MAG TPA: hypothetical protein P5217_05415 [Methanoregulaceae archaeon]|nr:hypothetical protein [Methanoregulaceae archaeon]HPD75845.1 hypothetical protein [Methanoregulaceae archaeon]HRY75701.1 hypothetical protein [Methanoregulaceae archaeon]